jgi:crotonobetainyl-CoA:carnitine CoA-transferase CaiB-like acyl-CoA transferase
MSGPLPTGAPGAGTPPLAGIKVIDVATLFAGPLAATFLADFGADVLKVEHPRGDPVRLHGPAKDGIPLWWKVVSRNKEAVTLYLGHPEGQALFRQLVADADVVIENFRPGTLERWGLGYDVLSEQNPGLVLARVTGFGQFGPYSKRPGFGTIAEAMSGFAALTGAPDGPPTLPPFALADGITALTTAFAILTALRARDTLGRGQEIDLAIIEPILSILGAQPTFYDQLREVPRRIGNRSVYNAPRNTYRTAEGRWVATAASSQSVAERVLRLVGRPDLAAEPWFSSGRGRAAHADVLDEAVGAWIGSHTLAEVVDAFEAAEAAVAPINDIADVMADPQYRALGSFVTLEDDELGPLTMQNVLFRLSATPGSIRTTGPQLGEHNEQVYGALGIGPARLRELADLGVV